MFRGNFSKNKYPYLGIFPKKGTHFLQFCHKSTPNFQNFGGFAITYRPIVTDFFMKNETHVWGFLAKKRPTLAAHDPLYVVTCEYPPPPGLGVGTSKGKWFSLDLNKFSIDRGRGGGVGQKPLWCAIWVIMMVVCLRVNVEYNSYIWEEKYSYCSS